jgi:thiol-disulfide isomerase/thioredoxin
VLLDFWATWCTGCTVEIPWFIEFDKKYQRQRLTTIGIAMDEEGKRAITALPVTFLLDKAGRIADVHAGVVDKTIWEQEIKTLLRESNDR